MGRSHDSWRRPSQDVSLDDLTGWRFGRSIVMEIPMSFNAVLVGGNMFSNRKREGIDTKVVHMANRCLHCGRKAWGKHQLKYWYIIYLFKTWRVHTKPTILDHLCPETFIGSCGVFPNPQSQHLPMLHRLTATNPLTFLNQLLAILEFWMSGYENWQIDSVEMSTICLLFAKDFTLPIFVPPMWWNHSQKSIAFAFDWSPIIKWWYSNFPWMAIISQQISKWVQWTHVFWM